MGSRGSGSGKAGGGGTRTSSSEELNSTELNAIYSYTNTLYEPVNTWLRLDRNWKSNTALSEEIHSLDSAIAKSPVPDVDTLYRGVSLESLGIKDASELASLDGKIIVDKGFMSTSKSSKTAEAFVHKMNYQEGVLGVVVKIKDIPKKKGLIRDVSNESAHKGYESEYLIKRNTALRYSYKNNVLVAKIVGGF